MKKIVAMVSAVVVCGGFVLVAQKPAPAVFTAAQAEAGRAEYFGDCVNCHTDKLTGRKGDPGEMPPVSSLSEGAQKMVANGVPALAGEAFLKKWGAVATKDLAARVEIASGPNNETRYVNLTAFILQYNGAKAGTTVLTPETGVGVREAVGK